MKLYCEKALVQNAVSAVARAVPAKSTNPALEGILLEADGDGNVVVTGFDMKMGIRASFQADVQEAGRIVLPSRLFGEIIRKMPDDRVSFVEKGLAVHLSCGLASFDLMGLDPEEYPELPEVEEEDALRISQSRLRSMIGQTIFAVSQDEVRPVHTGALFDLEDGTLTVVAVDGFRLALRKEKVGVAGRLSFIVPGSALAEAERICRDTEETVGICLGEKHVLFRFGDSVLVSRRLEGTFLDYKAAVPKDNPIRLTADRKELLESVERTAILLTEKLKSPIRCVMGEDVIDITARAAVGNAHDVCRAEGDGGGMEIGFNNRYMMDALRTAPCERVTLALKNPNSPCVITPADGDGGFVFMVLPVRLKA